MNGGLVLLGCGGHGKVVLDAALDLGLAMAGIVDPGLDTGATVFGVQVLPPGCETDAGRVSGFLNGVGANPKTARRQAVFERQIILMASPALVHRSAVLGRDVELASGAQVMAGAVVQCGTRLGQNVVINTGARVDHDCRLADHAFVGPGAVLSGAVSVGVGSFVGSGATILPGVQVGSQVVIAAGAVVVSDVADGETVVGCPGRPIKAG